MLRKFFVLFLFFVPSCFGAFQSNCSVSSECTEYLSCVSSGFMWYFPEEICLDWNFSPLKGDFAFKDHFLTGYNLCYKFSSSGDCVYSSFFMSTSFIVFLYESLLKILIYFFSFFVFVFAFYKTVSYLFKSKK